MSTTSKLVGMVLAGRYRIERQLGEGGMGAIFEATQLSLTRKVAIKVVKPAFENDEERLKRFEVETEAIARMSHPHIVTVVDAGREGDLLFLAMELLDGVTVRQALRSGPLGWRRALVVAEGVASALVAAHEAGVIHRDLKAENVVLWEKAGSPDFAKVLDFGVAKLTSQAQAPVVTGTGFVAGTPGCIAPEQILGKKDDARSDLYSLGVLLFEMLTGRPPFSADSTMELMLKHLNEPAPAPSSMATGSSVRDIPPRVDALTVALLAKDPDLRPKNAAALVAELRALRESGTHVAVPSDTHIVGSRVVAVPSADLSFEMSASAATQDAALPTLSAAMTPVPGVASSMSGSSGAGHTPMTSPVTAVPPLSTGSGIIAQPDRRSDDEIAAEAVSNFKRSWRKRGKRRGIAMISLVVTFIAGFTTFQAWRHERSRAPSHNAEAAAHLQKASDALWDLDLDRLYDEVDLAERLDKETPWTHLLRATAAQLDNAPFPRINREVTAGLQLAAADAQKNRMVWQADHADAFAKLLWMPLARGVDPVTRLREHIDEYHCKQPIEPLLFALRTLMFVEDPKVISGAFAAVPTETMRPAVALGLARAARKAGDLPRARELLTAQLAHSTSRLLTDELVDVELEAGEVHQATALLDHQASTDRNDLWALMRLGFLRARGAGGDWHTFDDYVHTLETLPQGDRRRVDGLDRGGQVAATHGRVARANELWLMAFNESYENEPEVAGQLASIAVFFTFLHEDVAGARAWLARSKEATFRMEEPISKGLNTFFALASNVLLAETPAERARAGHDLEVLMRDINDVPIVVPMVQIMAAQWNNDWDQALKVAEKLPPCMVSIKKGTLAWHHAMAASASNDVDTAHKQLEEARAQLVAALTPATERTCTRGADVQGLLNSMTYAIALSRLADTAMRLSDRELAAQTVARARGFWSPDPDLAVAQQLSAVEAWLKTPAGG